MNEAMERYRQTIMMLLNRPLSDAEWKAYQELTHTLHEGGLHRLDRVMDDVIRAIKSGWILDIESDLPTNMQLFFH